MPPKQSQYANRYDKDERVLCFHGPLLYEAKVLELKQEDPKDKKSAWLYRVHYKGWKNTWDDWVPENRLRKFNDENRQLERDLKRDMIMVQREEEAARRKSLQAGKATRKSDGGRGGNLRSSEERSSAAPTRGTKRGRDNEVEKVCSPRSLLREIQQAHRSQLQQQEEQFVARPSVRIPIPDHLKGLLVDDWENVTKNLQLVPLPHIHPITEILKTYEEQEMSKRRPGSADADILEEVIQGVTEYFNKSVGRILLYRFERQQWMELSHRMSGGQGPANSAGVTNEDIDIAGKEPCDVYGPEHLCRLFVSMPELIAQTNMDTQAVQRLREELTKMTTWLGKSSTKYFAREYDNPGQDYIALAKGIVPGS